MNFRDASALIAHASQLAKELTLELDPAMFRINMIANITSASTSGEMHAPHFYDNGVLVSSSQTGYVAIEEFPEENLSQYLGLDARDPIGWPYALAIATLDSVGIDRFYLPTGRYCVNLPSADKANIRASVLAAIVSTLGPQQNVVLIGAVPSIVSELQRSKHNLIAICDRDPLLAGSMMAGNLVLSEYDCEDIVRSSSVVVATGMMLANGTILELVANATKLSKPIILFCQSCSHLAPALPPEWPILACVCENFPHYFYSGYSEVRVYAGGFANSFLTSHSLQLLTKEIPWARD